MIVDDNLEIVEMLESILQEEGYHCVSATGKDAVAVAIVRRPNVILLDLMMPDVHGLSVLESLRATEQTRDIPVLLSSAALRLSLLGRQAGADGSVEKPFDIARLRSEIERLLPDSARSDVRPMS